MMEFLLKAFYYIGFVLVFYMQVFCHYIYERLLPTDKIRSYHTQTSATLATFMSFLETYTAYLFMLLILIFVPSGQRVDFVIMCLSLFGLVYLFELLSNILFRVTFLPMYIGFNFFTIRVVVDMIYNFVKTVILRNIPFLTILLLFNKDQVELQRFIYHGQRFLPLFIAYFVFKFYSDIRLDRTDVSLKDTGSWLGSSEIVPSPFCDNSRFFMHTIYYTNYGSYDNYYSLINSVYTDYKRVHKYGIIKRFCKNSIFDKTKKLNKDKVMSPLAIADAYSDEFFKNSPAQEYIEDKKRLELANLSEVKTPTKLETQFNKTQIKPNVVKEKTINRSTPQPSPKPIDVNTERGYRNF